ncbi:restriction endonuclease subunit S [Marinobacterium aestuariivivens]|uniref:Restriction endonuclease subunit S n=1 Tax=Marinobacterium aestuariivivens TaxID=1698799 RepID=A0ABW2A042_9GAMM
MNLPSNWIQCQVQDFADVKGGKRLPKGKAFSGETTNFPYIRVSDFSNGTVSTNDIRYIDQQTREVIEAYTISKEDLYVSIAGTIGLVGTIPDELDNANLTENAAKVCSISGVDQVFLSYLLRSKDAQDSFKEKTVSTTQPKLALYKIRELRLWLPLFRTTADRCPAGHAACAGGYPQGPP